MKDPTTPAEWQEAVDAAETMLELDSCRMYGLIKWEGKLDLAKDQLHMIQRLCGSTKCEEYEDLSQAINKAQNL